MSKIFEALQKAEQNKNVVHASEQSSVEEYLEFETNFSDDLVTLKRPGSVAAEQFRFWRSRIIKPQNGNCPKTVLITSALQGEGKTFAACNLAVTIAQGLDEYVLLVDADLRNPMVHKIFGLERSENGLSDYLKNGGSLSEMLCKTAIPKLTILPGGEKRENPAELLASQRMSSFIEEVRDRYPDRLIILDSAPVNLAPETVAISKEMDAIYLMLMKGETPRNAVISALEHFNKGKLKGIIFNKDPELKRSKRYHYGYGYRAAYGNDA